MIMKRFLTLAAMAALSMGAAACGGDDDDDSGTGPNEGPALSSAEVADAFDALNAIGLFNVGFQPAELPVGLSAQSQSINETQSCPNGGNVKVTGSVSVNQSSGAVNADIRQAYNDCKSASSTGRVWTFNGDPNLRIQLNTSVNQSTGSFSYTGGISGGFRYSSNGSAGSCTANVNISANANGGSVTGTMCGQSVNEAFDGF
jgi:hypothetical protein